MTKPFDSETGRELARRRHAASTPDQRRANTEAANKARGRVKDVENKVEQLGHVLLAELERLHARLDQLDVPRDERVAA